MLVIGKTRLHKMEQINGYKVMTKNVIAFFVVKKAMTKSRSFLKIDRKVEKLSRRAERTARKN